MGCSNSKPEATSSQLQSATTKLVHDTAGVLQSIGRTGQHHVRNVFAKPLHDLLGIGDGVSGTYHPPVFPKTPAVAEFLKKALPKNFVFENVNETELNQLVLAMEQVTVKAGEVVINQGDTGDYFYVVYSGAVSFVVDKKVVGSGSAGDSFGELSLLYTTPRAATVKTLEETVLYRVDQIVFRFILKQQSVSAASEKTDLLKKVSFLTDLDEFYINKLADVMTPRQFAASAVVMTKGDVNADLFYILSTGEVNCTEIGVGEVKYEDILLQKAGDYFGERALLMGEPRAATVTALKDTMCFTIDKKTFETVLGDFKTVILHANEKRKLVRTNHAARGRVKPCSWHNFSHLIRIFLGFL